MSTVTIQHRQVHNNQALRLSRPLSLYSPHTGLTNLCDTAPATHTKKALAHAGNNQAALSPLIKSLLTFSKSDLPEPEPSTIYAFICGHNLLPFFCTYYGHVIAYCWQWQLGVSCQIDNTRKSNLKTRKIHKATHHGNVGAEVTNCLSNRSIPLKSSYKTFTTVNVK